MEPALLAGACIATAIATALYRRIALRRGIIAAISSRTLHARAVPRGGGIAFGLVFSAALVFLWARGSVSTPLMLALGAGGVAAACAGFIDDVYEIRAAPKLAVHVVLSVWLVASLYEPFLAPAVEGAAPLWRIGVVLALLFVPVWLINLYNFIDGVDGMAILGAVFVSTAAILALLVAGATPEFVRPFALLGVTSAGFLLFNLPPARIFMGDAGSIFLGYCFAGLILATVGSGAISVWAWVAIFAYFIADTTTTTVVRMFLVRRWYGEHRSHAYQNLARIHNSHARVAYGTAVYHVLWALPMALWATLRPEFGVIAAMLALAPGVVWALRFGPLLSSE